MKWKKVISAVLTAAMVLPVCPPGVGKMEANAAGIVTDGDLGDYQTEAPKPDEVVPDANQYQYQKEELAAFCHFGMNTFTGSEWGNGKEDPSNFSLTTPLDADTYVKALKDAGFQKLIVTAKHHDGFCIWRSAYTDHDLESTNYEGDVLAEISAACTKYDMDMGLYLSPWDVNSPAYGYYDKDGNPLCGSNGQPLNGRTWEEVEELDALDYNEYYNNQLIEILGNDKYGNDGKFTEVWMDGAKGDGAAVQNYDFTRWFTTIQKYEGREAGREADCMLFGAESYTTVRWIGNENGFAHEETWSKSTIDREQNTIDSNSQGGYTKGYPDGNQWTVPEADARITSGWFWGASKSTPKSLEDLGEMYFRSVGHNAPLLLNVPPNNQGTVDQAILERLDEFGTAVRETFRTNYAAAQGASVSADQVRGNDKAYSPANLVDGEDSSYWTVDDGEQTGTVEIDLGAVRNIDVVSIEESIELGQRITGFRVEYRNQEGQWNVFEEGTTIGAKRLCRRAPVRADKIRITVTGTTGGVPVLNEVGVYKAAEGFEVSSPVPEDLVVVDNTDKDLSDGNGFAYSGWTQETSESMIGGTGMWANPGAELVLTFRGTKAWLFGTVDPNHGTADIYLDGSTEAETIDTYGTGRKLNQVIYTTPDLEYGTHTLRLVTRTKATGIQAAGILDNQGQGLFEIESPEYQVTEGVDEAVNITVRRVGGAVGTVKVDFQVNPGSAMQADFDADANQTLVFAEGETEKTVAVAIYRNSGEDERRFEDFTAEILPAAGEEEKAAIGFTGKTTVTIFEPQEAEAQELLDLIVEARGCREALYTADSYGIFRQAYRIAAAAASDQNAGVQDWSEAKAALQSAVDGLVPRTSYSEEDRFLFPTEEGQRTLAEAEYFLLDSSGAAQGQHVRVLEGEAYSNGKALDWFNAGNVISMPFTAQRAGIYTVTATVQSGALEADPNKLNWGGTHVEEGSVEVFGDASMQIQKVSFEITVTEAGDGVLTFTADQQDSPRVDCFEITPKELEEGTYQITASAGENGTISHEGTTQVSGSEEITYTITPDAGYEIADVLVDGISVGAVSEYTFSRIIENRTIEASFRFSYYTDANRAVLQPQGENAIEAEYFELIQTPVSADKYVRITENPEASNGKEVNWFEEGNKIRLPFTAETAGTYLVTAVYRSGRIQGSTQPNAFEWSGTHVEPGSLDVYGEDGASVFHEAEFEITITEAGEGELIFTAGSKAGPVIDKFVIERKTVDPDPDPQPVPVTGIVLDKTELTMKELGAEESLTATITPENAGDKTVIWSTSDPAVATVSQDGVVTAVGKGTAEITVTTQDGGKTAVCRVTVEPKEPEEPEDPKVSVSGIMMSPGEALLQKAGDGVQLQVTVYPENATDKNVTFTSSNPAVASVDEKGRVTAVSEGTAQITAATRDGGLTAICRITVKAPQDSQQPETPKPQPENPQQSQKPGKVTEVKVSRQTGDSLTVTWKKQSSADSYRVWIYKNKKWSPAGATDSNKLTIRKLKKGTPYSVKVEAVSSQGTGEASAVVKTATKPAKTGIRKTVIKKNSARLTFKKVKASGYEVWMKTGKGKYKKQKTVKKPIFTKKGLKSGKKYQFRARAYVKNGSVKVYGAFTKGRSFTLRVGK